jgi:hypothetical protein
MVLKVEDAYEVNKVAVSATGILVSLPQISSAGGT